MARGKPQSKTSFVITAVCTVVVLVVATYLYFGNSLARMDAFFGNLDSGSPSATSSVAGSAVTSASDLPALPPLPSLPAPGSASATAETASTGGGTPASAPAPAPTPTVKTIPYSVTDFKPIDWIKDWGTVTATNGALSFGASTSTTGGATFLAGSGGWANYNFQANVDWVSGESFSVIAREEDPSNFVYCDFGKNVVNIVERTADTDKTIGSAATGVGGAGATYELGIGVSGGNVECTVNGQEVAGAAMAVGAPTTGGIGFTSWDPTTGASEITITGVQVSPIALTAIAAPFPVPVAPQVPPAPAPTSTTPASAAQPTSTAPAAPAAPVALNLPYAQTNFAGTTPWLATWGAFDTDPSSGALIVEASDTATGSSLFLQGSTAWTNYKFDAMVDWVSGQTFGIVARYVDDKNYVLCEFDELDRGDVQVQLEQYVNGQQNILETGSFSGYYPTAGSFVDAYIQVDNTTGICSLDGHQISNQTPNAYLINQPFVGGIGFTVWDSTPDTARTIVQSVSVTPN